MSKISDVSKELQTDEMKMRLYNLVRQFVYKHQKHYYPHYTGDVEDLVHTIFVELMTPKSRIKGQEKSLLDRYDPDSMPAGFTSEKDYFANVVKSSTIRKLIDMERSDKREKTVSNNYDEKTGETTLDWLFNKLNKPDEDLSEVEFTPDTIFQLRDLYDEMPSRSKKKFLEYFYENQEDLYPNFKNLFLDLIGEDTPENFKKGENVHKSKKEESAFASDIKNIEGLSETHIEEHRTSQGDAIRIIFPDRNSMTTVDVDALKEKMNSLGYPNSKIRSNIWYFTK